MNQQEQNPASTKAFILKCIDQCIAQEEYTIRIYGHVDYGECALSKAQLKELKIRRQEVCEILEGVEDE
tara:strand:- start:2061 stop:2267 length:207 start_codon:yes stop_codon:yes gene_type:complete